MKLRTRFLLMSLLITALAMSYCYTVDEAFLVKAQSSQAGSGGNQAVPEVTRAPNCVFPDIDPDSVSSTLRRYYSTAVTSFCNMGYVAGKIDGKFHPEDDMTRAEYAKVLSLLFDLPPLNPLPSCNFSDVDYNGYFGPFIREVCQAGIITGLNSTQCTALGVSSPCYGPNLKITRAQIAVMIYRANLATFGYTGTIVTGTAPHFGDVGIGSWAYDYIETLYTYRAVGHFPDADSSNTNFLPNNNSTRGYAAFTTYAATLDYVEYPKRPTSLGQAFGLTDGNFYGVYAQLSVPTQNDTDNGHAAASLTSLTNRGRDPGVRARFIESGANNSSSGRRSIGIASTGASHSDNVFLQPNGIYAYSSEQDTHFSSSTWSTKTCDPGGCRNLLTSVDLGNGLFPWVAVQAETTYLPVKLGVVDTEYRMFDNDDSYWCPTDYFNNIGAVFSSCSTNAAPYFMRISWY